MKKTTGLLMCLCLLCGCAAKDTPEITEKETEKPRETEPVSVNTSDAIAPAKKEEKVTVHTDALGNVKEIEDVFTLTPEDASKPILDISSLSDIYNREGDEEFVQLKNGQYVWQCNGGSITAAGSGMTELPVGVRITYTLDGKAVSPEQIAGKSGHVKIRFDYENHTGSKDTITPFAALTALTLSGSHFKNITAKNMKAVHSGGSMIMIGAAFPGWQEALASDRADLSKNIDLPAFTEIEADTDRFELDFTATVFTNGLLRDLDEDDFSGAFDLDEKITQFTDALDRMASSGGTLLSGAGTFGNYLGQYTSAVSKIEDGTSALSGGMNELYEHSDALESGSAALCEGLTQLRNALTDNDPLDIMSKLDPEKQQEYTAAKESLCKDADILIQAAGDFQSDTEAFEAYIAQVKAYMADVSAALESLKSIDLSVISKAAIDAGDAQNAIENAQALLNSDTLSEEEKEAVSALILSAQNMQADIVTVIDLVNQLQSAVLEIKNVPELPEAFRDEEVKQSAADLMRQLNRISEILKDVIPEIDFEQLCNEVSALKEGIIQLSEGSDALHEGVHALRQGIRQLKDGTDALDQGVSQLTSAGSELSGGYVNVLDGISAFKNGLDEFASEGRSEISSFKMDEITDLMESMKTLRRNDLGFTDYSGITEGTEGSCVFIFESDAVKAD